MSDILTPADRAIWTPAYIAGLACGMTSKQATRRANAALRAADKERDDPIQHMQQEEIER